MRQWLAAGILATVGMAGGGASLFTVEERTALVRFWNAPGRLVESFPPEAAERGIYQVRLTPEGSRWLLAYQRALGAQELPPTRDAAATSPAAERWERWLRARVAYDEWRAQTSANEVNRALGATGVPPEDPPPPPDPGAMPEDLRAAVGEAPPFALPEMIRRAVVTFPDGEQYVYQSHVRVRPRYAYYRWPQGTVALGPLLRDMPAADLAALFAAAGFTPSEQRIAREVSRLEGGFESINTYDTGYVSVGFIQFITGENGRGSLAEVLARMKRDDPAAFARDFHAYGIDVDSVPTLVVVDPDTGEERVGAAAVMAVIRDRRLTAVFQRAGRHSQAFRLAQIRVAKERYWPANDRFTVTVGGRTLTGRVGDVIRSEAGMATLFDRKINRGNLGPFAEVVAAVMAERGLTTLDEAAAFEREIVARMRYRADFLAVSSLSQPPPIDRPIER